MSAYLIGGLVLVITIVVMILMVDREHYRSMYRDCCALVDRLDVELAQRKKDAEAERLSLTRRMDFERAEMRREIRRLTKALVVLKREHPHVLPPEHTDERWGSYVMNNETEMAEAARRKREEEAHEAVREMDRELLGAIEGELADL